MKLYKLSISNAGIGMGVIYLLVVLYSIFDALTCYGDYCGMIMALPILNWIAIGLSLGRFASSTIVVYLWYAILVIVNLIIFYFIGFGIEKLYIRLFKK